MIGLTPFLLRKEKIRDLGEMKMNGLMAGKIEIGGVYVHVVVGFFCGNSEVAGFATSDFAPCFPRCSVDGLHKLGCVFVP